MYEQEKQQMAHGAGELSRWILNFIDNVEVQVKGLSETIRKLQEENKSLKIKLGLNEPDAAEAPQNQ